MRLSKSGGTRDCSGAMESSALKGLGTADIRESTSTDAGSSVFREDLDAAAIGADVDELLLAEGFDAAIVAVDEADELLKN